MSALRYFHSFLDEYMGPTVEILELLAFLRIKKMLWFSLKLHCTSLRQSEERAQYMFFSPH